MSDITRPVPNELLITAILEELNAVGISDDACTVLIATGMHRPSTAREREVMLGDSLLQRVRVVQLGQGVPGGLFSYFFILATLSR